MVTFADSGALWLLLLLPLIWFLAYWAKSFLHKRWLNVADRHLLPAILNGYEESSERSTSIWLVFSLGLFIIALSRPQFGEIREQTPLQSLDLVILLDVSKSMLVEDVPPNRLELAKKSIRDVLGVMGGDRVGLVAFAGQPLVIAPLTQDAEYLTSQLEQLQVNDILVQGTDLGAAVEAGVELLERGGASVSKTMLIFSDGEDNEEKLSSAIDALKKAKIPAFVVGVGTRSGGEIIERDEMGRGTISKRDDQGRIIKSSLEAKNLEKLASSTGGEYFEIKTLSKSEVSPVLELLSAKERALGENKPRVIRQEQFMWPLALGILFFLRIMGFLPKWNRKPNVIVLFLALLGLSFASSTSAMSTQPSDTLLDPKSKPEEICYAWFNLGTDAMLNKDHEKARVYFQQALKPECPRARVYVQAAINNVISKRTDAAIADYVSAIELLRNRNPADWGPGNLETALLRARLDLVELLKNKDSKDNSKDSKQNNEDQSEKEQKESENKKNSEQNQDEQKNDKNDDSGKSEEKKDQGKQNEKSGEQQSGAKQSTAGKRDFKGEKLNQEEAMRVLDRMDQAERDAKRRLKLQQVRPRKLEKDW